MKRNYDGGSTQNTFFDEFQNPFERKRQIKLSSESFTIPPEKLFFKSPIWKDETLQLLKHSLNNTKSKIDHVNPKKWHEFTRKVCICGDVKFVVKKNFGAEYVSRAWIKMYEMLAIFDLVPPDKINDSTTPLSTLHLCEAPGAFVAALNHFLATKHPDKSWNWMATTLNPYYEGNNVHMMINEDNLIKNTLSHWTFLKDNTGNILDVPNIDFLVTKTKELENVLLVTADGSIDCQDNPGEQEITVSRLHFAEIITALCILDKTGSLVVKIFTVFECQTVCNLYLLSCLFSEVTLVKPATSGDGNSEIYIVCIDFQGTENIKSELEAIKNYVDDYDKYNNLALYPRSAIPQNFMDRIYESSNFFAALQMSVIERNIQLFNSQINMSQHFGPSKTAAADKWMQLTKIERNEIRRKLLPMSLVERKRLSISCVRDETKSYQQRQKEMNDTSIKKRLNRLAHNIKKFSNHKYTWDNFIFTIDGHDEIVLGEKERVFVNIYNSQFCMADLLIFRNELRSILSSTEGSYLSDVVINDHYSCDMDSIHELAKKALKNEEIEYKNKLEIEVLCFHETIDALASKIDLISTADTLLSIIDKIKNLQQNKSLFVCEILLLTRLHVGFVIILSSFFEIVKLCVNQKLGVSGILFVNFKTEKKNEEMIEAMEKITIDLKTEKTVPLSIVSCDAFKDDLIDKIVRYNFTSIYHCLIDMIQKVKDQQVVER